MAKKVKQAAEVQEPIKQEVKKTSVLFHELKLKMIQELQPQMETNAAWVKNMFPIRIAELIEQLQGQIKTEPRVGAKGVFEFARIYFPDGSSANLPTQRALEQKIEKNEWAHSIQRHLMRDPNGVQS